MIRKSQMLSPDQLSAIQEGYQNESFDASIVSSTTGPLPRLGSKNSSIRSLKSSTLGADGKLPVVGAGGGGNDITNALRSIHTQFNDVREEMIAIELSRSKSTEDREKGIHIPHTSSTSGKSVTFPETLTRINSNNTTTGPLVISPRTNNNNNNSNSTVSPRLEPLDNRPTLFPLEKNILDQMKPLPLPQSSSSSSQRQQQQQPSPEQKSSTPLSSSSKIKQEKCPVDEFEDEEEGNNDYSNEEFTDHQHQSPQKKILKDQTEKEDSLYEEELYEDDHHEPHPPTQIQIQATKQEQKVEGEEEQEYENVYAEEDNNTEAVQKSPFTPKSAKGPAQQIIQNIEGGKSNDDGYEYDHYESTKKEKNNLQNDQRSSSSTSPRLQIQSVVADDPLQKDDDYQQDDEEFLEEPARKNISIQNSNNNLFSNENNADNQESRNNINYDRAPYLSSDWRNDSFDEFDPITHVRKPRNNVQEIEMTMHSADFEMLVMSLGQMTHIMH
jgi:hypothetical protein